MSGKPARLGKISNRYLTDNLKCLNMQKKIHFLVNLWNHEHGESLAEHGGSLAKQVKPKDQKLNLFFLKICLEIILKSNSSFVRIPQSC